MYATGVIQIGEWDVDNDTVKLVRTFAANDLIGWEIPPDQIEVFFGRYRNTEISPGE